MRVCSCIYVEIIIMKLKHQSFSISHHREGLVFEQSADEPRELPLPWAHGLDFVFAANVFFDFLEFFQTFTAIYMNPI